MKLVYIAGPFRGENAWEIENNIRRAECLALSVWRLGAAALCPHANTRFFSGALPDETWLAGDLEMLRRCDALILTEDWRRSTGARKEADFAFDRGIPVFTKLEDLEHWLKLQDEVDTAYRIEQERKQYFEQRRAEREP